jgi:hypothetical protein
MIIHFGLMILESEPVKLIANAITPIGNLTNFSNELSGLLSAGGQLLHMRCSRDDGPVVNILPQGGEHHGNRCPPEIGYQRNREQNGEIWIEPSPWWAAIRS